MSRSLNKATLIGNVGGDPEVRTAGSNRVATFSLATSKEWSDAQGQKQSKVEWHRCVAWSNAKGPGLTDVIEKYVRKGDKLYVEGEIEYRTYEDKEGQTRYTTEIKVKELMLLGGKSEGAAVQERPKAAKKADSNKLKPSDPFNDFPSALADDDDDMPF